MSISLSMTGGEASALLGHLRDAPERVAFAVATSATPGLAVVSDLLLVADGDLEPGPWCVQLTDAAQGQTLMWATARTGWLIEMHSHLGRFGDPACLSSTDVEGLREWVPHVRWRLQGRPYMAVVVGPTTADAVAWDGVGGPTAVASLIVDGASLSLTGLSEARFRESHDD